jgi:hypothetical protein
MKHFVYFILILFLSIGCQKKSMSLAKVAHTDISNVTDHSPVYITVGKDSTTADFNRKNLISSTNWIIHVDKHLKLVTLAPHFRYLMEKRQKRGMHDKPDAKIFFSVANQSTQQIGFIKTDPIEFMPNDEFSMFYVKEHPETHMSLNTLRINFDKENNITVDGNKVPRQELLEFLTEFIDFTSEGKQTLIYLNFEENLTFQEYINNIQLLSRLKIPKLSFSNKQFIYNQENIPDCNCAL